MARKSETLGEHMTIKRAKELARYLPRCGREICVLSQVETLTYTFAGTYIHETRTGKYMCRYYLRNTSGKYSVYKYCDVSRAL